jgi:hypothetical protein
MDIAALKEIWIDVPVAVAGETITVTFNAARMDDSVYDGMTLYAALEYAQTRWDLTSDGVPLAPITAENLEAWCQQYPWLWPVPRLVFDAILEAVSPKALARAMQTATTLTP